jgi:BASS family bile acid:Na+ symporter
MQRLIDRINGLYVVWLLALAAVALWEPRSMLWFDQRWIFWSLAASMLGMGSSLSLDDFRSVARMPGCVALGFGLQYTVMPLCGWLIATLLGLDADLKAGLVLVASCPGGMASNMISYLARADVALSVMLTLCSTMLAFIFTPLWTTLLVGRLVPVDAWGLCLSALQLTVAPVAVGVLLRWLLPRTADRIGACGPTIAMLALVLVRGGMGAASAGAIAAHFGRLMLAAFGLHVLGFALGYAIPRVLGFPEAAVRTVSIEVGMQNGGLAASLARQHFAAMPLTAAAGVFSGVMQNVLGGLLATFWKGREIER